MTGAGGLFNTPPVTFTIVALSIDIHVHITPIFVALEDRLTMFCPFFIPVA